MPADFVHTACQLLAARLLQTCLQSTACFAAATGDPVPSSPCYAVSVCTDAQQHHSWCQQDGACCCSSTTRQTVIFAVTAATLAADKIWKSDIQCLSQGEMVYRFAKCRDILALPAMEKIGLPMPEPHVDVIHHALPWEQLKVSVFPVFEIHVCTDSLPYLLSTCLLV